MFGEASGSSPDTTTLPLAFRIGEEGTDGWTNRLIDTFPRHFYGGFWVDWQYSVEQVTLGLYTMQLGDAELFSGLTSASLRNLANAPIRSWSGLDIWKGPRWVKLPLVWEELNCSCCSIAVT